MHKINFDALNLDFLTHNNNQHIIIEKEGIDFHFKIALKVGSDKLVVFSNGAVNPSKKKPPIFMRSNWSEEMEYNALFIDDRTIHGNNLRLGWGVGTNERHFLIDYSEIVKKIISLIDINDSNTFYYGSSAGGFMSLVLATMHDKTIAIVNNPQTYVYKYYESAYKAMYKKVFPDMSDVEIHKTYSDRLSITSILKKHRRTPKTYYFQNRLCKTDMENHVTPFMKNLDKYNIKSEPIHFILYNDKDSGHNPLSKEKTLKYIDMIVNREFI
ncbi:hypothetical protein ETI06_02205 [Macrococcoides goetzii]|nr:hypothetical protein [Macrococcus goetzii]TDM50811.1 hypothetical protein ETI06_02205 [Macrococcus goetzii]